MSPSMASTRAWVTSYCSGSITRPFPYPMINPQEMVHTEAHVHPVVMRQSAQAAAAVATVSVAGPG